MGVKLYKDPNAPIEARVEDLLNRMTLEEKVAELGSIGPEMLLDDNGKFLADQVASVIPNGIGQITRMAGASGIEPEEAAVANNEIQQYLTKKTRLGIPAILHEECLSGLMTKGGTTYPQSIGMACTWEPELIQAMTEQIRKQMLAIGARLGLSPVLDVARDYRWGRVEETFGEDPYLVAAMAVAYIKGLQGSDLSEGVIGTLKHFAGHGFGEGGRNHAPVNIGMRDLRESALFPYEAAIQVAKAGSVMNAYHILDGIPCASSRELLTDILRKELGFDGIVVADYSSIKMLHTEHKVAATLQEAGIMALEAGLDIELPKIECYGEYLVDAAKEGLISISTIDLSVKRHLRAKFNLGLFENPFVEVRDVLSVYETKEQRELARDIARKSIVLLKNENNLLPISKDIKSIAVIGPSANSTRNVLGDYAYSAHVNSPEDAVPVVSVLDGIKARVGSDVTVGYAEGCGIMSSSKDGFDAAVNLAKKSDLAIVVVGGRSGLSGLITADAISDVDFTRRGVISDTDGESHDRTSLNLFGVQEDLVKAIHATNVPTIVILVNGRPLSVEWIDENIPAVLEAWLPGSEAGNAVADVLFGDHNPSGKLCVSIPYNAGQMPVHYNRTPISYTRMYLEADNLPLYPFGYGLSYTTFEYRNLNITPEETLGASEITVEFDIQNTGKVAGTEVAQLYINDQYASRSRPVKELKGFQKVSLEPGETKRIQIKLSTDQLAFYDKDLNLVVEPGKFTVMIGSSSEDIRLSDEFEVIGETKEVGVARKYFSQNTVFSLR